MKKTLAIVTFALAIVMSFALAACTVQHVHNFDTPWSYNETEHWHTCTDCDEIRDKAAHTGGKAICGDRAICEVCGQPYGEIGNHDWGEWKQTKAPTCSEEGVETRVCKINPEHKENRPIAKLNHEWSEDWKKNETEHWRECSVCKEIKDKAEHLFGDYQVTTQPTYESTGLKKRTCSVCLHEETEVIDKLVKVDTITIEGESEVMLDVGEFVTLTALVAPENATDKGLNWQSSDASVAEVVKGRVVARGAGVATITVTANDGQGASATVTVKVTVLPESVTLNCDDKYIAVGQKTNITATVLPADATDTALTYEADNPAVATVDENGRVTGLKEGVVTVTAKTSNNVTASVSFYVTAATIDGDLTDALYQGKYALHNDALKYNNNTATNPVKNLTKVVLGESGLYITHDVTDNFVGKQSRVEDFICFGDTKVAGSKTQKSNTYYFRFYLHKENGRNFTNYYNGNESGNYPWTYDASLEVYYVVKATENGYTVEAFIPYATLGVSQKPESVQFLGLSMIYPDEADAAADKNIKSAVGNSYGMAQKNFFNLANYLTFDDLGYYGWANSSFGIIEKINDVNLGSPDVIDGNYQTEITIKSKFQLDNSFTAYEGLTFDNEYVTEKGSGIYKISVPEEKQPEYKDGVTVSVKRGTEVLGTFKIALSKDIPVQDITIDGNLYTVVGGQLNLGVTYIPADANAYKTITWTTGNDQIATVDENGVVTGVGLGSVVIKATTGNGVEKSVTVLVAEANIDGDLTDALYQGKYALHNDALKYNNNTATNPVKNLTKVVLGESGLYITHDVTDNFVGKQSRVEDFICFGDTKVAGSKTQKSNTYYFRFYLHKENGRNFTNYYNGNESGNYPWTYDASLEVYYVVKATENGYTVEAFIPYATLGVSQKPESVQFLGLSMIYPDEADAAADKNIKSAVGNSYGMAQKNFFNLANYLTFDDLGYYGWANSSFGIIEKINDVNLGSPDVIDGNYQTEITIKSKFQLDNSFTAYEGLTFDNEYVTEKGSGIYKISVPEEKQPEYKDGVTVSVKRGTEVLDTFKIKLSKNIPVTQITVSGAKTAFLGDEVQLSAAIEPSDATVTTVTWASKNEDIATIDQTGKVSTLKAGTATFTATADGIVTEHTIVISDTLQIEIQGPGGAFVGDEVQLTAIVTPKPNDYTVTWDSNDKEIATIDATGKVTLLKEGTVTLTATVNGFTGEYTLFVGGVLAKAAVKVDYTGKTVQNSGTNDTVTLDTVTITLDSNGKNGTEFVHTDNNTFNDGIDGDKEGALATNNKKGSYLLIKDYALGKGDFTISSWVYASSEAVIKGNSSQIFATSAYDKQNPDGKIALAARKDTKGHYVTYKINNDKNNNFPSARTNLVGWHKYTVVRAGTSFKVYVDDVLMHERTLAADTDFGTQTICFGSYIGETWAYNDGVLVYDNVTIYDTAITENQLKALVAAKK